MKEGVEDMADQRCPNCGGVLPAELGQHSLAPISGLVVCPHCGAEVHIERPEAASRATDRPAGPGEADAGHDDEESFSGHETVEGVMDEISDKPGGTGSR
jgi:hypothetical protein